MDTETIGKKLVEYCNSGREMDGLSELYHPDAVSVEARAGEGREAHGLDQIKAKHEWWKDNMEVHSQEAKGPFPLDDRFAVVFTADITEKASQQRMKMEEVGLYTVREGKIVKEEFMYTM
ncbi:nuclear transport factor 2 family protein [Pseudobacteriovorax antillogorgiicola]|uniref:SnoaL-like domain-containing protein n=1 Tax=Pseudobacteriovorax antillogorgiicola TaxID=1513793 RepID=A0A1Y6CEM8_9BACT|nr:nuclear transport factor 2 family protein [Pseudobacteriovorax antillogorgiicola]TCS49072.1 SnoaL-like protein [Pseudobacteriovorax antillogorgiicola]SMF52195.1 SnoaL-like domain-containing protein [Pseudobacteriovorax antillogorgiicola]